MTLSFAFKKLKIFFFKVRIRGRIIWDVCVSSVFVEYKDSEINKSDVFRCFGHLSSEKKKRKKILFDDTSVEEFVGWKAHIYAAPLSTQRILRWISQVNKSNSPNWRSKRKEGISTSGLYQEIINLPKFNILKFTRQR